MLGNIGQFWALVGFGAHVMGAIAAATAAAWLLGRRKGFGDAWPAVALGLGLTAAWCLVIAVLGEGGLPASIAEAAASLSEHGASPPADAGQTNPSTLETTGDQP